MNDYEFDEFPLAFYKSSNKNANNSKLCFMGECDYMMQFISEKLLLNEINRKPKDEQDKFFISMCKRELAVLQRLKVEKIDLTGSIEDVEKRIGENHIYFMDVTQYDEMWRKAQNYDAIKSIIDRTSYF